MECKLCSLYDICKYRSEIEPVLKATREPHYLRNNENEETPVRMVFTCDMFIYKCDS